MATDRIPVWHVVLETKRGQVTVEVPTFQGKGAAERRAVFALASKGVYGDLDEITVTESSGPWMSND